MARPLTSLAALLLSAALLVSVAPPAAAANPTPEPVATPASKPADRTDRAPSPAPESVGSFDVYDVGAWVRQYRDTWCTAAATQMMINMILDERDATTGLQRQMYYYARRHDTLHPASVGSDPAGWAAALRRFGGGSYVHRTYRTRNQALRAAATAIRTTGRPVGLLVWRGRHAWVMTGYASTADPAMTSDFLVTGVHVSGPLLRDPRPNKLLDRFTFDASFTRYQERDGWPGWVGMYVIIIPVD